MNRRSLAPEEEKKLAEGFARGDEGAFDALVEAYTDRIYSFAYRLSGRRELAEDSLQETFVKAWKSRKKFDASKSFRAWIFAIARNATTDLMRKSAPFSVSSVGDGDEGLLENIADGSEPIEDGIDRRDLSKAALAALEELSSDQKAAALLHDIEGMTFEEIASVTGKPLNTVKSHYRRAILALRRILPRQGL